MPASPLWQIPLVRHLSRILVVKLVVLFVIWYFFFSQPAPAPQAQSLDQHFGLVTPAPETPTEE